MTVLLLQELFNNSESWETIGIFSSLEKIPVDLTEKGNYVFGYSNKIHKLERYRIVNVKIDKLF